MPEGPPLIRGEKVFLRPAEREDLATFVRWFNDAETAHFLAQRSPLSMPLEERWFENMLAGHGKDSYHFVICRLEDEEPIGTIGLFDVDHYNGGAGFGITIGDKALWGRGYGTDALNALVDFGFGQLRLERIWCHCYVYNQRGRRSYEKAGFQVEGTLRRAHYQDGVYHDVWILGLVRSDWEALPRGKSWELD